MSPSPLSFVAPRVRNMVGYVPGLQLNDPSIVKLNTNENAFPLPAPVLDAIEKELRRNRLHLYPNPSSAPLRERLAALHGVGAENVFVGNGSDEVLRLVFQVFLERGEAVGVLDPSYSLYPVLAEMFGNAIQRVPLRSDWTADFDALAAVASKIDIITNPNAPTGIQASRDDVLAYVDRVQRPVLVDEAYMAFGDASVMDQAGRRPLLLSCNTFSKAFSLAGMRIGWLVAHADVIREVDKLRDSYNVSALAQVCALAALDHIELLEAHAAEICRVRDVFSRGLSDLGFEVLPSRANFVFAAGPGRSGRAVYEWLLEHHVLARHFSGGRLDPFVRISIGTSAAMEQVLHVLGAGVEAGRL